VANRSMDDILDVAYKVYTRDVFGNDWSKNFYAYFRV
jgi:hypothetical protein